MKTFTAKQFTRTPGQVFEAAREDGKVEITHDRFKGIFTLKYFLEDDWDLDDKMGNEDCFSQNIQHAMKNNIKDNGDGTINLKRPKPFEFNRVKPIDDILQENEWSLNDPIPNVYVDEKIDCKRHPGNKDHSKLGVKEFHPASTHRVGDVITVGGKLVVITEITEALIKYETY